MRFPHWLTLLFVALKLNGTIGWSWWLVLLPLILFVALSLLLDVLADWKEDREFKKDLK